MVRTAGRVTYLVLLVAVVGNLLIPSPTLPQWIWIEGRWGVVVLTAISVRELYTTGRVLWRCGRRRYRRRRRRQRLKAAEPSDAELKAPAAKMFPDPPRPDEWSWAEELALVAIKGSLRGLFSLLPKAWCATLYRRLRRPTGLRCIYCRGTNLTTKEQHYRDHYRRHTCRDCTEKRGHEVTFTDLSGTIIEGSHLHVRLWLWGGFLFVPGCSTQEIAGELHINYKSARRMVSLFQLAYITRRFRFVLAGPVEIDEIYIIGGLKGNAGGLSLDRLPRRRGLKKPGRGVWDTDKVPILGLVDRQGHIYLIPCANVQTKTIRPFVERPVAQGAQVYTDEYSIYAFPERPGYRRRSVNHSQGEYARDQVHVNTPEGIWSLLRAHLAVHRGLSKVYLPLYVARFEFLYNRRRQTRWEQMVDLLALSCRADGRHLRYLIRAGQVREACPIPGLAMA